MSSSALFAAHVVIGLFGKKPPPPPPEPEPDGVLPAAIAIAICWLLPIFLYWSVGKEQQYGVELKKAKQLCSKLVKEKSCAPILVRLAWHDSGTFDNRTQKPWPEMGGAIGSIRTSHEINAGPNAGLKKALDKYLSLIHI